MAIILDLESDDEGLVDPRQQLRDSFSQSEQRGSITGLEQETEGEGKEMECEEESTNFPNLGGFSAILGRYPIVIQLATHLDLNTLDALATTCRQFRANLLPYRAQLVAHSLRCINDDVGVGEKLAERLRESRGMMLGASAATQQGASGSDGGKLAGEREGPRLTSGRVGRCARDLVNECRRCGTVVCRNCIIKPPAPRAQSGRHRRLCRLCLSKPLSWHTRPDQGPRSSRTRRSNIYSNPTDTFDGHNDDSLAVPSASSKGTPTDSSSNIDTGEPTSAFTAMAFSREPCTCSTNAGVWICAPCARASSLTASDTTYQRGWQWRTRYAARRGPVSSSGSLGNGVGDGVEGVECGRRAGCAAAKQVEVEEEVTAYQHQLLHGDDGGVGSASSSTASLSASGVTGGWPTGYHSQEIQGVGGTVRRKLKRLVLVGAAVGDVDDEGAAPAVIPSLDDDFSFSFALAGGVDGDRSQPLWEERSGRTRSWCAWCCRVIPSAADEANDEEPTVTTPTTTPMRATTTQPQA